MLLAQGKTQGSTQTMHQKTLTTGPFNNTFEANEVSPEVAIVGCRTQVSTTRGNAKCVILTLYNIYCKLIFRKEQKRYNGKYKHYTEIFHLETQTGKTNIYYIDTHCVTLFTIQYTYRSQRHPKP
jgi:hypothetical protein